MVPFSRSGVKNGIVSCPIHTRLTTLASLLIERVSLRLIESLKPVDPSHGLVEALWKVVTQRGRTVARARVEMVWRRSPVTAELGSELVMPL